MLKSSTSESECMRSPAALNYYKIKRAVIWLMFTAVESLGCLSIFKWSFYLDFYYEFGMKKTCKKVSFQHRLLRQTKLISVKEISLFRQLTKWPKHFLVLLKSTYLNDNKLCHWTPTKKLHNQGLPINHYLYSYQWMQLVPILAGRGTPMYLTHYDVKAILYILRISGFWDKEIIQTDKIYPCLP